MNMEQTECSETSAHKIQMPGNHLKKEYNVRDTAEFKNEENYFRLIT
jgi:hypothetical protein